MTKPSETKKHNGTPYRLPQMQMTNSDLSRLINSDEVQSVVNAPKEGQKPRGLKLNPLKNKKAMAAVNPAAASIKAAYAKKQADAEKAKAKPGKKIKKDKAKEALKKIKKDKAK